MEGVEPSPVWSLSPLPLPIGLHPHLVFLEGFEPVYLPVMSWVLIPLKLKEQLCLLIFIESEKEDQAIESIVTTVSVAVLGSN